MSLLKPRNRSVVFRLTEDEYDNLRTACVRSGGRSLSDFARSALLATIASNTGRRHAPEAIITRLEARINETNSALQSLILLVTRIIKPGG